MSKNICVYYGGSFSPITLAHKAIAVDAINHLLMRTDISKINFIFFPTCTSYGKASVKEDCISFTDRFELIELVKNEIIDEFCGTKVELSIIVSDFEQVFSEEINPLNGEKNGYLGTFVFTEIFSERNNIKKENVYLLYGEDNINDICIGAHNNPKTSHHVNTCDMKVSQNLWENSLHLFANYNFLIYPRDSKEINHEILLNNINLSVVLFEQKIGDMKINKIKSIVDSTTKLFCDEDDNELFGEYNHITGDNDIDDIKDVLYNMNLDKIKNKILVINVDKSDDDKLLISEISSTKLRELLSNKSIDDRLSNTKLIEQMAEIIPSSIINKLINSNIYY
jgi:nicotinic acid mononucleotide adenylyltransferase